MGRPDPAGPPVRFGVVGHGWRADFFLRLARALPDLFECTGVVTRGPQAGAWVERRWGVATYRTVGELLAGGPEVVVVSVPRAATPDVVRALVGHGTAVLAETPPAPDLDGLRSLWADVGAGVGGDLVQVAEQHPFLPVVAALRALLATGELGEPTSAHVTWTHGYHATALLRHLLGVAGHEAVVTAVATPAPLLEGPDRQGWPREQAVRDAVHTLAVLRFAPDGAAGTRADSDTGTGTGRGARTGVYDFTDGQWFNPLRRRHLLLRASRGEVVGTDVTWAGDDGRPVGAPIVRRQTGLDGNLEGADLDTLSWAGRVLFRNPYPGARLSDEEIAVATCLELTGRWRRGEGPPPYPLADACQDHLLSLAIDEAAGTGRPVTVGREPWAASVTAVPAGR